MEQCVRIFFGYKYELEEQIEDYAKEYSLRIMSFSLCVYGHAPDKFYASAVFEKVR
jgi:hypothetical protein